MKIIFFRICMMVLLFINIRCVSYKTEFRTYNSFFEKNSEEITKKWLESMDAVDEIYSVLTFTEDFEDTIILIINASDTIYEGKLNTIKSLGHTKSIKIDNRFTTKIVDVQLKKTLIIKSKNASKYKHVYVSKSKKRNQKYTLTFSNDFKVFM